MFSSLRVVHTCKEVAYLLTSTLPTIFPECPIERTLAGLLYAFPIPYFVVRCRHSPPAQTNAAVDAQEESKIQNRPDRTRKKLDLRQNKRGAFSVLLGTLSKAKKEDKIRNASEAVSVQFLGTYYAFRVLNSFFFAFIGTETGFVGKTA